MKLVQKAGLPRLAKGLSYPTRAAGLATAAHGTSQIFNPETSLPEKIGGGLEIGMGGLGVRTRPSTTKTPISEPVIPQPESPIISGIGKVKIKIPTPELVASLKQKGYVSAGISEEGYPQMILSPEAVKKQVPQNEIPAKLQELNQPAKFANEIQKKSLWKEVTDFNRSLLTAYDLSAPGRQGKPLMFNKEWWTSLDDMFKSWGSERAFNNVQESIKAHPYFQAPKGGKSLADVAGLDMTDMISHKEEVFRSRFADKIPGVAASNRAYVGFLNKLRADSFNSLIKQYQKSGVDPTQNLVLLKNIGSFINDATGRGRLPKMGSLDLERNVEGLSQIFFAPKLMASRVNMYKRVLDPRTYSGADPVMRKQVLKSLFATAGTGMLVGELARMAGAEVSNDPTSSDFRKIKIGDTRIDPFSGFQQYAVAAARLTSGKLTNSTSGKEFDLSTPGYGQPSRASIVENFFKNKLAPIPSFVWAWMSGKEFDGTDFDTKKALLQRTIPIIMQDLYDLQQEDPELLMLAPLPIMGEGIQTYGR